MKPVSPLAKPGRRRRARAALILLLIAVTFAAHPMGAAVAAPDHAVSNGRRQLRRSVHASKKPRRRSRAVTIASVGDDHPASAPTRGAGMAAARGREAEGAAPSRVVIEEIKEGGLVKLLQRDGAATMPRPLLVNFWATWCEPCRKEFPDLVMIDGEFRARGLDFITVSLDDVSEIGAGVPQFLREMRATQMPAYLLNTEDPETAINAVDKDWHGELPATFLYDARGHLVFKHMGRINAVELRTALKKVLSAE